MSRSAVSGGSIPGFVPHARFRFDPVREAWIVLLPERLLLPDAQAVAVLKLIDGARDVDAICAALADQYAAPPDEIAADVQAMVQDLVDKKVLRA